MAEPSQSFDRSNGSHHFSFLYGANAKQTNNINHNNLYKMEFLQASPKGKLSTPHQCVRITLCV